MPEQLRRSRGSLLQLRLVASEFRFVLCRCRVAFGHRDWSWWKDLCVDPLLGFEVGCRGVVIESPDAKLGDVLQEVREWLQQQRRRWRRSLLPSRPPDVTLQIEPGAGAFVAEGLEGEPEQLVPVGFVGEAAKGLSGFRRGGDGEVEGRR